MLNLVNTIVLKDETNAYLDGTITIEFDKDIDESTVIEGESVRLYLASANQQFNMDLAVDGANITISPATIFPTNSVFNILFLSGANGIKAIDASELDENKVIVFTTGTLLKPEQTEDPEDVADSINAIENVIEDLVDSVIPDADREIVVPDISKQGEIEPFIPCPPDFSGTTIDTDNDLVIGTSAEGSVVASGLNVIGAIPGRFAVGIEDVSEVRIIWDKSINVLKSPPVLLSYQTLPSPDNPFQKTDVAAVGPAIIEGETDLVQAFDDNSIDTENKEFTAVIKAGNIESSDSKSKNSTEKIIFSGPLSPMFCSVDRVKMNAGMWHKTFNSKDLYYYTRIIHEESAYVVSISGYGDETSIPADELVRYKRWVCCSAAVKMLAFKDEESRSGSSTFLGSGDIFVKKRDFPGVSITYDIKRSGSSSSSDERTPESETFRRLIKCLENNAPPGDIQDIDLGAHAISHGIKSRRGVSKPVRRRL